MLLRRGHSNHPYLKISCLADLNNTNLFMDICTEYNLVVWWVYWGHKIDHRLVRAHLEMGSWNVIVHYLMDSVTNGNQALQIHFHLYTYFGCWVPITARAAWQEEGKKSAWKILLTFYLEWKPEQHVSFLFLSRNLFPGGSLKNGTWYPCVQTDLSVRKHPVNTALGRPGGSSIFLQ